MMIQVHVKDQYVALDFISGWQILRVDAIVKMNLLMKTIDCLCLMRGITCPLGRN